MALPKYIGGLVVENNRLQLCKDSSARHYWSASILETELGVVICIGTMAPK